MIDTAKFFESFDKAGFLKPALWTPSVGLPGAGVQQSTKVRFHAPTMDVLSGEVNSVSYRIEYPASVLLGLKRGEVLTVDGVTYTVRENPDSKLDGSLLEAKLRKGV